MFHKLPDIKKVDVKNKTVFVRADLDVPLNKLIIEDDTRLLAGLPTIEYLINHNARVIIGGHLGRPEKKFSIFNFQFSKVEKELSLEPVAKWYVHKFKIHPPAGGSKFKINMDGFEGWKLSENLILLENLRFFKEEEENDLNFAKKLASLADVFVNDAFAMSHRKHTSVFGLAKQLPHFAGLRLQKEVGELGAVLINPRRPLVVVIGGKKVETKLPLVEKMHQIADYVLVGGKIAQEKGVFLKVQHEKIRPLAGKRKSVLLVANSNEDGTDITQKDAENFLQIIDLAKTVVWNGPMGLLSSKFKVQSLKSDTEMGTRIIAKGIAESNAYKIVGGGDSTEFLKRIGVYDKFNFVSTGGGAMLSFLSGEKLPGLEALNPG
ncbi:phosphoglycerate kinase [Candidatus Microgenomates bacterium]|nr:MAG: phosphoglycerate kinase [Candidatus Microgenomates bacterium]